MKNFIINIVKIAILLFFITLTTIICIFSIWGILKGDEVDASNYWSQINGMMGFIFGLITITIVDDFINHPSNKKKKDNILNGINKCGDIEVNIPIVGGDNDGHSGIQIKIDNPPYNNTDKRKSITLYPVLKRVNTMTCADKELDDYAKEIHTEEIINNNEFKIVNLESSIPNILNSVLPTNIIPDLSTASNYDDFENMIK